MVPTTQPGPGPPSTARADRGAPTPTVAGAVEDQTMKEFRVPPLSDPTDGSSRPTRSSRVRGVARRLVIVLAWICHAALGVTVSVSGLIMPPGAVMLLGLFWIAGVVAMLWNRHRPGLLTAVPAVSWAVWFAVVVLGEAWLGWTA